MIRIVAIIMSVYNGSKYIEEQLESILRQTEKNFILYIRDDGSTDQTVELIRRYTDPRIYLVCGQNLGPAESFFTLLRMAEDADYVFFSDQDDVWDADKLERMLSEIKKYGDAPTMVFSDFRMIDAKGDVTNSSYTAFAGLRVIPGANSVFPILAQPYVFGCAAVINKPLTDIVKLPPKGIEMHDCWISQAAACVGNLIYYPEQTISHRFHSSNTTGKSDQNTVGSRIKRIFLQYGKQVENTELRLNQIFLLLRALGPAMHEDCRKNLEELAHSLKKGKLPAIVALSRFGVKRQKTVNTIFFYATVLWIKGEIQ